MIYSMIVSAGVLLPLQIYQCHSDSRYCEQKIVELLPALTFEAFKMVDAGGVAFKNGKTQTAKLLTM